MGPCEKKTDLRAAGQSEEIDMVATAPAMQNVVAQLEVIAEANADVLYGRVRRGQRGGSQMDPRAFSTKRWWLLGRQPRGFAGPLLESELFGHEKGAFTGAAERRLGRLNWPMAAPCCSMKSESLIWHCSPNCFEFFKSERLSGSVSCSIRTDVRVIAATNRDLAAEVGRAGSARTCCIA